MRKYVYLEMSFTQIINKCLCEVNFDREWPMHAKGGRSTAFFPGTFFPTACREEGTTRERERGTYLRAMMIRGIENNECSFDVN